MGASCLDLSLVAGFERKLGSCGLEACSIDYDRSGGLWVFSQRTYAGAPAVPAQILFYNT